MHNDTAQSQDTRQPHPLEDTNTKVDTLKDMETQTDRRQTRIPTLTETDAIRVASQISFL